MHPSSWENSKEEAHKLIHTNREGCSFLITTGLPYPISMYRTLENDWATRDIKEVANYADVVTHAYPDFAFDCCFESTFLPTGETIHEIVGLAYVALYAQRSENRAKALKEFKLLQLRRLCWQTIYPILMPTFVFLVCFFLFDMMEAFGLV
jgi:hypothetical protein